MPRTREQLEQAAAEAEAWLDSLDPATTPAQDAADLRAIARAQDELVDAEQRLRAAVAHARENGKSWSLIGMALGVSKAGGT